MQRSNPVVNAFYQSKAWQKTRKAYYNYRFGICERCNNTSNKMIVHHKTYINSDNINDTSITLDWSNLELLCIECHNKEHFEDVAYKFDDMGNLISNDR